MPTLEPLEVWWTSPFGLVVLLLLCSLIFWAGYRFGRAARCEASCDAYERGVAAGRQGERLALYQRQARWAAQPLRQAALLRRAQGLPE